MKGIRELESLLAQRDQQLLESQQRMRELQHRFLNDLAGLSLHLSSRSHQPENCSKCIALVDASIETCKLHYEGFGSRDKATSVMISGAPYLLAVAREFQRALARVLKIETSMDPAVLLSRERVVLVGLILHEAVTNARKYAFPNGERGTVHLEFQRIGNKLELVVSDDGVGFDPAKVKHGTGMQTMHHLASQLSGTIRYMQLPKGTELRLNFPAKPVQSHATWQSESGPGPSRTLAAACGETPARRPKASQLARI